MEDFFRALGIDGDAPKEWAFGMAPRFFPPVELVPFDGQMSETPEVSLVLQSGTVLRS